MKIYAIMFVQSYLPHINKYSLCVQHCASFWGPRWIRLICCPHGSQRQVRCNLLLFRANPPCLALEPTTIKPQATLSNVTSHSFLIFTLCPILVIAFKVLMSSSRLPYSPSSYSPTWNFMSAPYLSEVCIYQWNQFTPQRSMRSYLMTIVYSYILFSLLSYCVFNIT